MDHDLLEQLLHEEEGPALDFKRDQYQFAKATEDDKAELLKDLLGFANAWRRADADILIGVQDVRGGRGQVVGVSEHLDDHSLQQFVNHLTNRPMRFQYEAVAVAGLQVGVIRIELQDRPLYLKRDFGRLRKGEVYVRRGSSTNPSTPATPDEIAQMGRHATAISPWPEIRVEFADPETNDRLGITVAWESMVVRLRSGDELPDYAPYVGDDPIRNALTMIGPERTNRDYYRDFLQHGAFMAVFRPTRLAITNIGSTAARDVRVEVESLAATGVQLVELSEAPEVPERSHWLGEVPALRGIRAIHRSAGGVDITQFDDRTHLEIDCGNLQPGRTVWSDRFYIAATRTGQASLNGRIYAASLPEPKAVVLTVDATVGERELSAGEVIDVADSFGS